MWLFILFSSKLVPPSHSPSRTLIFLKSPGQLLWGMSLNLDLNDCILMIRFRLKFSVEKTIQVIQYPSQCVL